MKVDLKGKSRKALEKLAADVQKAIQQLAEGEKKQARAAAEKAAKAHGFSLEELAGSAPAPAKKAAAKKPVKKVAPKYRNPDDASQTWTGRGRRPLWVVAAEKSGKTLEDLLIK